MVDSPFHGEKLKFSTMVLVLSSSQGLTTEGHGMVPTIQLLLGQNCTKAKIRCVCLQQIFFVEIWISEDQGHHNGFLQHIESLLGLSVQSQGLLFLLMQIPSCIVMEWFSSSCKILDEPAIMTADPKKSADCSVCHRLGVLSYFPEVVMAWPYPFSQDMMTQVFNLLSEKTALGGFTFQSVQRELFQQFFELTQMLFLCAEVDDHIIQIHQTSSVI